jgi:hypothetical protein
MVQRWRKDPKKRKAAHRALRKIKVIAGRLLRELERKLAGTELAQATVGSVRLKLLKVAAQVRVSVRRVYVQLSSAYPLQALFRRCQRQLLARAPASG